MKKIIEFNLRMSIIMVNGIHYKCLKIIFEFSFLMKQAK